MIYRRPTLGDLNRPDFRALLLQGVSARDVGLEVNQDKLFTFCWHLVAEPTNYSAFAEEDGKCVAYIGGITAEHMFHSRATLNIVAWFSVRPFAGMRLFTMCLEWARSRPAVKSVCLGFDPRQRERVFALLRARGLDVHDVGSALIHV